MVVEFVRKSGYVICAWGGRGSLLIGAPRRLRSLASMPLAPYRKGGGGEGPPTPPAAPASLPSSPPYWLAKVTPASMFFSSRPFMASTPAAS